MSGLEKYRVRDDVNGYQIGGIEGVEVYKASDVARVVEVGNEILTIMKIYHEQEKSSYGVDTPGGLEHMGDVWSLFLKWERLLARLEEKG